MTNAPETPALQDPNAKRPLPPTVFVHVPKCAGTHFRHILAWNTPKSVPLAQRVVLQEEMGQPAFLAIPPDELDAYHLISGHFGTHRLEGLTRPRLKITFLREPVRRALSLYDYWRVTPSDARVFEIARAYSLEEMLDGSKLAPVDRQLVQSHFDNAATWQIADRYIQRERSPFASASREELLAAACRRLEEFWVGIVEDSDSCIDAFIDQFDLARPTPDSWRRNEGPADRTPIGLDELAERLGDWVELDAKLYEFARTLVPSNATREAVVALSPTKATAPDPGH